MFTGSAYSTLNWIALVLGTFIAAPFIIALLVPGQLGLASHRTYYALPAGPWVAMRYS